METEREGPRAAMTDVPRCGCPIGQIAVSREDVERATAFYRDSSGVTLLFQAPPQLSFFDCDGVRLMLSPPSEAEFDHRAPFFIFGWGHT